jgi:hypothetical protein
MISRAIFAAGSDASLFSPSTKSSGLFNSRSTSDRLGSSDWWATSIAPTSRSTARLRKYPELSVAPTDSGRSACAVSCRYRISFGSSCLNGFQQSVPPTRLTGSIHLTVLPISRRRLATERKTAPLGSITTAGPAQASSSGQTRFGINSPADFPLRGAAIVNKLPSIETRTARPVNLSVPSSRPLFIRPSSAALAQRDAPNTPLKSRASPNFFPLINQIAAIAKGEAVRPNTTRPPHANSLEELRSMFA